MKKQKAGPFGARAPCKGVAIGVGVTRRGARLSGERALRVPLSCSLPVSHAGGPQCARRVVHRSPSVVRALVRAASCAWSSCARAKAWRNALREQGNERQRNGSATPPAGRSSMTELAFPPRVCCSFVGHGCDFEGETEFRCKRNFSEFRPKANKVKHIAYKT